MLYRLKGIALLMWMKKQRWYTELWKARPHELVLGLGPVRHGWSWCGDLPGWMQNFCQLDALWQSDVYCWDLDSTRQQHNASRLWLSTLRHRVAIGQLRA